MNKQQLAALALMALIFTLWGMLFYSLHQQHQPNRPAIRTEPRP